MAASLDLSRSQFACTNCRKDAYKDGLFAKSEDGKIIICSKECFNEYRSIIANRNSTKWYFCFPITSESIERYIQTDKQ